MLSITPDLLRLTDGSSAAAADCPRRREELYSAIIPHEYGGLPPVPLATECVLPCRSRIRAEPGVGFVDWEFRGIEPDREFQRKVYCDLAAESE